MGLDLATFDSDRDLLRHVRREVLLTFMQLALKDFRRIATRYDRRAANYPAAVCLAATVSYWS